MDGEAEEELLYLLRCKVVYWVNMRRIVRAHGRGNFKRRGGGNILGD